TAEFRMFHETAVANFFELATHRDRIEIIHFFEPLLSRMFPGGKDSILDERRETRDERSG
ncbi:MAG: hypothetical protein IJ982_15420, partial [Fibrobacter sp.]|nr:hypothetical protein [Fibrobacter sp.]